jgi:hypothetical protein
LFFAARDAAIGLLDHVEAYIANESIQRLSLDAPFPEVLAKSSQLLRQRAKEFLEYDYDHSPGGTAGIFCRECTVRTDARLLENLLAREGRVIQQRGRDVVRGVAFRGNPISAPDEARSPEEDGQEEAVEHAIHLPTGISHRVRNLFLLNLDLHGELADWLGMTTEEKGGDDE